MKDFNVTGLCMPEEDYMVDIRDKIKGIKELIDDRRYFTINRARQYGKTTTLVTLKNTLQSEYTMVFISFEGLDDGAFATSATFCTAFLQLIQRALQCIPTNEEYSDAWFDPNVKDFMSLSRHITKMCKDNKVVLMIDEVDKVSNNLVFLHFLSMMREKFLARKQNIDYTFHSVILTGVYDIKNIKLKMIKEGVLTSMSSGDTIYNSPWNIAADFEVDMSFSPTEIASMLAEYESDHCVGMDISAISEEIFNFTSGYPYLVSRICLHIDKKLNREWTATGVRESVKIILTEKNTLFDDVFKNLENNSELYYFIHGLLIEGEIKRYIINDPIVGIGFMYGFLRNMDGRVAVSNRIFEILMTDYFISKDLRNKKQVKSVLQRDIVQNDRFNMELCLVKFAEHYAEIFNNDDIEFLEKHGRLIFLSYLTPLINGKGFYHIDSQFTDLRRMDLVVDYGEDQFIIELKIWRGEQYEKEAYEQLCGYLEHKLASVGYLLTFDFRKVGNKVTKAQWLEMNDKRIFDVVV